MDRCSAAQKGTGTRSIANMTNEQLYALSFVATGYGGVGGDSLKFLLAEELVVASEQGHELTERGRVFLECVLALPLPERVTAWRMPGTSPLLQDVQTVRGLEFTLLPDNAEGEPPPKPPAPKPIPGVVPAEDMAVRREQVKALLNRGYGTSEIAETLELELSVVEGIFFDNG
jgi:hypothetical protein